MNKIDIENSLFGVVRELHQIFEGSKEYYLEHPDSNFKVRPDFGYAKFYLDWVDNRSYDMSLQALIHFILFEKRYYKKLLSKSTYKKLSDALKKDNEKRFSFTQRDERDAVLMIESYAINFVKLSFESNGLDIKSFTDANFNKVATVPNISKTTVIDMKIVYFQKFFYQLSDYIEENILSEKEKNILYLLSQDLENVLKLIDLIKLLFPISKELSAKIIKITIEKAIKNSEFSMIARIIKSSEYFNDSKWSDRVLLLKNQGV